MYWFILELHILIKIDLSLSAETLNFQNPKPLQRKIVDILLSNFPIKRFILGDEVSVI